MGAVQAGFTMRERFSEMTAGDAQSRAQECGPDVVLTRLGVGVFHNSSLIKIR